MAVNRLLKIFMSVVCIVSVIATCGVSSARAQVRCFRSLACGGPNFFMTASVEECCLSEDGNRVEKIPGSEVCEMCVVFGWISGDPDPNNSLKKTISFSETGERQPLTLGFSKGIPTIDAYDVVLSESVTEGTASQGVTRDFRLEGNTNDILVSFTRAGSNERGGPTTTLQVIIQNDNVALEPDEDFTLSLDITFQSPDNLLTGGAVVIVTELQVFVKDQTELTVQFTELDYTQDENRGSLPVAVLITAEIASDFEVRIVTRNLTQVYTPLPGGGVGEPPIIPLPDGFTELETFDPDEPYIASSVDGLVARVDYDTSTQFITFTAGPARTIQAPVDVFDDNIKEADEEYLVMFLETDDRRVNLTCGRFASRGIIRDNELTTTVTVPDDDDVIIGFEKTEFTVPEDVGHVELCLVVEFPTPDISFAGFYRIGAETVEGTADSADYGEIVEESSPRLLFTNENRHLCFNVTIIDDELFEDREFFIIEARENPPVFINLEGVSLHPHQNNVTITIIDLDNSCPAENTTLTIASDVTYSWPVTEVGETQYQSCPGASGTVSRSCVSGVVWSDADFSQCSVWVASILETVTSKPEELQPKDVSEVIELMDTVLTEKAIADPEVAELYLNIFDSIQQVNASVIQESEEQSDTSLSSRVIESLGRFQDEVKLSPHATNGSQVFTRERFAIQVRDIKAESFRGETFNIELGSFEETVSLNTSIPEEAIQTTTDTQANATASITVPPNFITDHQQGTNKSQRLSYSVFLTDILFLSPNQTAQNLSIGTIIIAIRLGNFTINKTLPLLVNNTFRSSEIAKATRSIHCVHWEASDKFGEWSSDGCREVESEGEEMTCECSIDRPSTHFAVLFDLNPSPPPPGVGTALEVITYVGLTVSVLSLIIMIVTYLSSKDLRKSQHGQILLNIFASLLGLYIFFLIAAHVTGVTILCALVSALLHYFILVFFGWAAAEAVYLYIKLVKVLGTEKYERGFTWKAGIIVWVIPALIVIISLTGFKYYTSKYYCRPTQWPFFFGLVFPVAVIIIFYWIVFFIVIVSIFKHTQTSFVAVSKGKIQRIKQKLITAMVLAVMFGLGWGLGFLATSTAVQGITITFQIIFALFVGSQGLLLLIFHGFRNEKVRELWKRCFKTVSGKAFSHSNASTSETGKISTAVFAPTYSQEKLTRSNPPETVSISSLYSVEMAANFGTVESGSTAIENVVGKQLEEDDLPTHYTEDSIKEVSEEEPNSEKNEAVTTTPI